MRTLLVDPHTAGRNKLKEFATPGWRIAVRTYSRQYHLAFAGLVESVGVNEVAASGRTDREPEIESRLTSAGSNRLPGGGAA